MNEAEREFWIIVIALCGFVIVATMAGWVAQIRESRRVRRILNRK